MSRISAPFPPVEEVIHGVTVRDPYRWLEDRSLPETEEWLQDQKRLCDEYFAESPDLDRIRERVREYLDVEVMDQPARIGEMLFFRRRAKGEEQGCIYVRENGVDRLLVDPSSEGIFVSVGIHGISLDGRLLAYERKEGGEDMKSIHVVAVQTGQRLLPHLERGFARGFVFASDNQGFFFCHETPNAPGDHEVRLRLFDESVEDQVVFRAARSQGSRLILTADEVHLGAILIQDRQNGPTVNLWIAQQSNPAEWKCVISERKLPFTPVLRHGHIFAVTQNGQENKRFVELGRDGNEVIIIIPEESGSLRHLIIGDHVYASFYDGLQFTVRRWSLNGLELANIPLLDHSTIHLLPNLGDGHSLFFSSESFAEPPTLFEYHADSEHSFTLHKRRVKMKWQAAHLGEERVAAGDGVMVPVTLVHPTEASKPSPTIMTGYGGFGVCSTPQFSVLVSILLELGFVFALAHVRGGGELGRDWHEAARGPSKQRSIDDFVAIAEWLHSKGITSPGQLGIFGGSNGGLLVGAAMTKRPDLFGAVLCIAPLLDMVRYESFGDAWKWRHEYGSIDVSSQFAALYSYSPYHHIKGKVDYPPILIVSGDKDTRCSPAHARKMVAALQNRHSQRNPVVLEYSEQRGHSAVLPLAMRTEALAKRIRFLARELGPLRTSEATYDSIHS